MSSERFERLVDSVAEWLSTRDTWREFKKMNVMSGGMATDKWPDTMIARIGEEFENLWRDTVRLENFVAWHIRCRRTWSAQALGKRYLFHSGIQAMENEIHQAAMRSF